MSAIVIKKIRMNTRHKYAPGMHSCQGWPALDSISCRGVGMLFIRLVGTRCWHVHWLALVLLVVSVPAALRGPHVVLVGARVASVDALYLSAVVLVAAVLVLVLLVGFGLAALALALVLVVLVFFPLVGIG